MPLIKKTIKQDPQNIINLYANHYQLVFILIHLFIFHQIANNK